MKSALVVGASRGIGRQIALTLARNGYNVGVAAKSLKESDTLPGSIHTVTREIEELAGVDAEPLECNVRDEMMIRSAVHRCIDRFGGLDLAVYNAGAIMWSKIQDTPLKRFDLMHEVNMRGAYAMVQEVLPHFLEKRHGRIVLVSPPIYNRFFKGKTAYAVTKVGMTVLVHGLANELQGTGVSISALWPATAIESHVTLVNNLPATVMRKSTIFADACLAIAEEKDSEFLNGKALIDEDYMRTKGVQDFSQYRCQPDQEPPRMMPKRFPSLLVEEENDNLNLFEKSKL